MQASAIPPPSEDKRWRIVGATLRRHGYRPDALLEALHTIQGSFGFIDRQSLRYLAAVLRLPLSQVYAVTTFSPSFTIQSSAASHACAICLGTACQIRGAQSLLDDVARELGSSPAARPKMARSHWRRCAAWPRAAWPRPAHSTARWSDGSRPPARLSA